MTFTERIEGGIGTTREKRGQGRGRNYRVAAEQEREIRHSLGASSPGCSGGRVGKRRTQSLQLRLWNLNSTSNSPVAPRRMSCQIIPSCGHTTDFLPGLKLDLLAVYLGKLLSVTEFFAR